MYTGRSVPEAVRKWQQDAKWRVEQISRGLGIDMELSNRNWYEVGDQAGLFRKTKSRDTIEFQPYKTIKIDRKLGSIRPVGKLENELAIVTKLALVTTTVWKPWSGLWGQVVRWLTLTQ